MNLTLSNYHSPENHYISNSKLSDFLKDKQYFYKKHISFEIQQEITDALVIGSAVDTWITQGEDVFRKLFLVMSRRNTSAPDYKYQLNPTMVNKIEKMCRAIERQDAYKQLSDYQRQVILTKDTPLGQFEGICGMIDFLKVKDGVANIVDLKTAQDIGKNKYHYHCLDYGYYRQMGFYTMLVRHNFPEVKEINCLHLVMEKDTDEIYTCQTFILSNDRIAEEINIINNQLDEISKESGWLPNNTSWDKAIIIGELTEEF